MPLGPCGSCPNSISARANPIKCNHCNKCFHVKCAKISTAQFLNLKARGVDWLCNQCHQSAFPLAALETCELLDFFINNPNSNSPLPAKKTKCDTCAKRINKTPKYAFCYSCSKFNHLQCVNLTGDDLPLIHDWLCTKCSTKSLPFAAITNDDFLLTMNGVDEKTNEFLKNVPSFSIQSLIDQIPGQKFDTDEFISDTIESKYYTPAEFISTKFSKKSFTMFHMNIASLQAHIDELKSLLTFLDHPFDVIGITETRLNDESPPG